MALTAIADNGDFLALDQADVSVTIIINMHFDNFPSTRFTSPPHVRGGYENPSPASAGLRWSWRGLSEPWLARLPCKAHPSPSYDSAARRRVFASLSSNGGRGQLQIGRASCRERVCQYV